MKQRFLERLASDIFANYKEMGNDLVVVLPNQRAGVFLRYALSKLIDGPVLLPKIITIRELFYELSDLNIVEQSEQLFRLFEVSNLVGYEVGFEEFMQWGPILLKDFDEIDTNYVDVDDFFPALYADKEIRQWKPGESLTEKQVKYLELWKNAERMYRQMTSELINKKQAYSGLAYRYVIDNLDNCLTSYAYEHILIAGFNALNRCEEKLFKGFESHGKSTFYWDYDHYYLDEKTNKAGQYLRDYEKWTEQDWPRRENIGKNVNQINFVACVNDHAQCIGLASILSKVVEDIGNDTAIILSDEGLLENVLRELPENVDHVNITMGLKLSSFPINDLIDKILKLNQLSTNSRYPASLILELLSNSILTKIYKQEVHSIKQSIIKNNETYVSSQSIVDQTSSSVWSIIFQENNSAVDVVKSLQLVIEQIRDENNKELDNTNKILNLSLFEFYKLLNQLSSELQQFKTELTTKSLRLLVSSLARSASLPFQGEPIKGLQIMGMLESRCLDFKRVIVLSANEGKLPRGNSGQSFIPQDFKRHFKIQSYKDRDAIYAYSFYRLLHHPTDIHLLYSGSTNRLGGGEASRFIMQLRQEWLNTATPITESVLSLSQHSAERSKSVIKTDEVLSLVRSYLQESGLSASAMGNFVFNPLDFYYNSILRLRRPNMLMTDVESSNMGNIVHEALEKLYTPCIGKQLTAEDLQSMLKKAELVYKACFKEIYKDASLRGMNYLLYDTGLHFVKEGILLDIGRVKENKIEIISLEEKIETDIRIPVNGELMTIKIKGVIDRIQTCNGKLEIIDYKTGKAKDLCIDKLDKVTTDTKTKQLSQLLFYSLLVGEKHENKVEFHSAILSLISSKKGIQFISNKDKSIVTINAEIIEDFKVQLGLLVEEILNPEVPFELRGNYNEEQYSDYTTIYA